MGPAVRDLSLAWLSKLDECVPLALISVNIPHQPDSPDLSVHAEMVFKASLVSLVVQAAHEDCFLWVTLDIFIRLWLVLLDGLPLSLVVADCFLFAHFGQRLLLRLRFRLVYVFELLDSVGIRVDKGIVASLAIVLDGNTLGRWDVIEGRSGSENRAEVIWQRDLFGQL